MLRNKAYIPINNISSPLDVGFVCEEIINNENYHNRLIDDNHFFVNGHGGDSVFLQNPSHHVGAEYFYKKKPYTAYRKIFDLSKLKSLPFFELFRQNINQYRKLQRFKKLKQTSRSEYEHPWLHELTPGTASYDHLSDIIYMTETVPLFMQGQGNIISPLLSPNVFISLLSQNYKDNFNHQCDRLYMREKAFRAFGDIKFMDIRK